MSQSNNSRRNFLKAGSIAALGAFASRGAEMTRQGNHSLNLYVGTYTSGKSEGIYIYRMNLDTGELKRLNTMKAVNPSFLAINGNKRHLYAVNEVRQFAGKSSGAVSAFSIDSTTGNLNFLNQQPSLGADPCHVIVDRTGRFVLVANYTGGNVSVFPVRRDGSLDPATDVVQHHGSSVNKEHQEGPHAHCLILDHANCYAFAADLGLDKVLIYRFDARAGKLTPGKEPWVELKPGAGPRHFTFHPNGRHAYVIKELDSTLTGFSYDAANGILHSMQTVSTLPTDFSGHNDCADLHISPSGKFLYGSNRGHNSIVVFTISASSGELTYLEHASTQGKTPRNFAIDPTGRFLLVANQQSDTIVTLRIDSVTGRLTPTDRAADVPAPVCLKFV
ncbi:MAG: lactonase family protein [Acidobacteriota bacterium]|nr:lactonase family protein [Acidobacteriota bacterium]